jgi:hypothetical protein
MQSHNPDDSSSPIRATAASGAMRQLLIARYACHFPLINPACKTGTQASATLHVQSSGIPKQDHPALIDPVILLNPRALRNLATDTMKSSCKSLRVRASFDKGTTSTLKTNGLLRKKNVRAQSPKSYRRKRPLSSFGSSHPVWAERC